MKWLSNWKITRVSEILRIRYLVVTCLGLLGSTNAATKSSRSSLNKSSLCFAKILIHCNSSEVFKRPKRSTFSLRHVIKLYVPKALGEMPAGSSFYCVVAAQRERLLACVLVTCAEERLPPTLLYAALVVLLRCCLLLRYISRQKLQSAVINIWHMK